MLQSMGSQRVRLNNNISLFIISFHYSIYHILFYLFVC